MNDRFFTEQNPGHAHKAQMLNARALIEGVGADKRVYKEIVRTSMKTKPNVQASSTEYVMNAPDGVSMSIIPCAAAHSARQHLCASLRPTAPPPPPFQKGDEDDALSSTQ